MCYTYPTKKKEYLVYRVERKPYTRLSQESRYAGNLERFFIVWNFSALARRNNVYTHGMQPYPTSRRSLILIVISA